MEDGLRMERRRSPRESRESLRVPQKSESQSVRGGIINQEF